MEELQESTVFKKDFCLEDILTWLNTALPLSTVCSQACLCLGFFICEMGMKLLIHRIGVRIE